MFEFVTAGPNLPFSVALMIMVLIALLEGVGTLFGVGLSNLIETFVPDVDIDFAADLPEGEASFAMSKVLGWLQFGKVPALILLVVFLTAFGVVGLGVQMLAIDTIGSLMPGMLASLLALWRACH